MARAQVFASETPLWHPTEGWRTFPVGETDPGAAWHEKEGGELVGSLSNTAALKDLIIAQDQIEAAEAKVNKMAADLAVAAGDAATQTARADEAEAKVDGLEQAVAAAEAVSDGLRVERDTIRAYATELERKLAAFDKDGDGNAGGSTASDEKDELMKQLTDLGVEFDRRLGPAKLKELLDIATAPPKDA